MNVITVNGIPEVICSHNDLVYVVEKGCGHDVANMVSDLDPANYTDVYNGYNKLFDLWWDYLKPLKEAEAGLTAEQLKEVYEKLESIIDMIGDCL